jgi:tetratricopeptide (TPR) repeat protein
MAQTERKVEVPEPAATEPSKSEQQESVSIDPNEETKLILESDGLKRTANTCFASSDYDAAITGYNRALETLPTNLDYEIAVLKGNISACYIKLEEWKDAIDAATAAIDGLEGLDPLPVMKKEANGKAAEGPEDGKVQEIDDAMAEKLETLARHDHAIEDVRRIRVKALLRRAKARLELGGWANLAGADEGTSFQTLGKLLG